MKNLVAQWDKAAKRYTKDQEQSEFVESNKQVVKARFKNLTNQRVLDLGCGYGYYTNYFKSIGADVLGVDASSNMIKIARSRYKDCSFDICDITEVLPFADNSFDLIFCNQVLMDIENIEQALSECYRILKPNGIFYYSIVHPAFYDSEWIKDKQGFSYAKLIHAYITPYSFTNEFWGKTEHFHRSLSYYLNVATEQGFILQHVEEPISYDGTSKNKDLPLFFFAEYKK
jgi:ubiquinone/menaquinone biosynthesis C-methylase UbiE